MARVGSQHNLTIDPKAPSAARVVYDYYSGKEGFPKVSTELIDAVDKADSAQFDKTEILAADGWVLVNFILDPRTGLSIVAKFSVPQDSFMRDMTVYCRHHPVEEILKLPDTVERVGVFWANEEAYEMQLRLRSEVSGSVVVVDLREEYRN